MNCNAPALPAVAPFADAGNYAFNDLHAMMAFVGAGREHEQQAVLDARRAAMQRSDDNAAFTREVGRPATLAVQAFGRGDYAGAVRLLRPIRSHAHRFGGSHAQRDVLDLTLIEAALRGGDRALAWRSLRSAWRCGRAARQREGWRSARPLPEGADGTAAREGRRQWTTTVYVMLKAKPSRRGHEKSRSPQGNSHNPTPSTSVCKAPRVYARR